MRAVIGEPIPKVNANQTEVRLRPDCCGLAVAKRRQVVGAAGFEPATCSTQNCRATRLRYTPPGAALDTCFAGLQQGVKPLPAACRRQANPARFSGLVPAGKNRALDAVSRRNPKLARGAPDDLE